MLTLEQFAYEEVIEAMDVGAEAISVLSVSSGLEEAANEYAYRGIPDKLKQQIKPIADEVSKNFIAGAKWQKEKMLKDAVEGTVHNFSSNMPHPTVLVDAKGFNQGDKVRIIIVKEEDKWQTMN